MSVKQGFSGRFGLVIAALGMAIGTGNLWRFPRIAAKYEGGAFLIPWLVFLVSWSVPILIAEFTLGRESRRGPIGAFARLIGRQTAWMGAFMAFTTIMIGTYYSVVTGWVIKYLVTALTTGFPDLGTATDPESIRASHQAAMVRFNELAESPQAVIYHLIAVSLALAVVWRGVRGGVELLCKVLIPLLFVTLLGGAIWALTSIEGAVAGLNYFFDPNWQLLKKPDIWMDALSQSAWSTGAGFGLILTYGAYARKDEDAVANNCTAAFGNNCASLLAGLFVFPATFGLLGAAGMGAAEISGVLKESGPASTGLAFQYVPFIFNSLPQYGNLVTSLFFGALLVAALSSLVAMYELGARTLGDLGIDRTPAVLGLAIVSAAVGVPSALSMDFFITMDWVWSIGLVIGGLLVVSAVQLKGIETVRTKYINPSALVKLGWGFNWVFVYLLPLQGAAMLFWWLSAATTDPAWYGEGSHPWDPLALGKTNVGAPVIWCGAAIVLFILANPILSRLALRPNLQDVEGEEQ